MNARRGGNDNWISSVVAETMKLLVNSSHDNHIMHRSQHKVKKYLSDEKTHGAIIEILIKRLCYINDQLCEVEHIKSEIEHKY